MSNHLDLKEIENTLERQLGSKKDLNLVSLAQQVSTILMNAILEGQIKGGEQLIELKLQKMLGVSRSPLREAFRELEKKGIVEIIPRRGTFVKSVTSKDIKENFPVRAELEGLAASIAVTRMNQDDLTALSGYLQEMEKAVAAEDISAYHSIHIKFHEIFINRCENDLLISILKNIRMQAMWHRFSLKYFRDDLRNSFEVHEKILQLFKKKPPAPEETRALVAEHINCALERFLSYLEHMEKDTET